MINVLIVEDEPDLAELLSKFLQAAGMEAHIIFSGTGVVDWIRQQNPNIVILDIMLPGKDGIEICKEVRKFSDVPIIMATAKVDELDRLVGFDTGATDYVCKPYSAKEVVARIKSLVGLYNRHQSGEDSLIVDNKRFCISFKNREVELSKVEFNLFSLLYHHPGRIYSRSQIIDQAYQDYRVISDRTVDSHIKNLRKKIAMIDNKNERIHSIYGMGYKYDAG